MDKRYKRIVELENWFAKEYIFRLEHIRRCNYFNIPSDETMYALMKEAYEKEQEYRNLIGKKPLKELENEIFII